MAVLGKLVKYAVEIHNLDGTPHTDVDVIFSPQGACRFGVGLQAPDIVISLVINLGERGVVELRVEPFQPAARAAHRGAALQGLAAATGDRALVTGRGGGERCGHTLGGLHV